jgi:trehalose 6-phosphate phosphatase
MTSATPLPRPPVSLLTEASLFLDFDGTLVDIAERPEKVVVGDRIVRLIGLLASKLHGRLAILTGRPVDQIGALLGHPPLMLGGSHGLELRWPDGRTSAAQRPTNLAKLIARMQDLQRCYPGVRVEEKPYGAALHYREAPEAEDACRVLTLALAAETGLRLQPGKMVFEVSAQGADKGAALKAFMDEPPMAGTIPVFLGDDRTDEAGFGMAATFGGAGILVGAPRQSLARYRLIDVESALAWLEAACAALA